MPIQNQLLQAVFRAPSASLTAQDETMTESLETGYQITKGQAAAVKKLFTAPLSKLGKVVSKARKFHRTMTFEGFGSTRIIVAGETEKYSAGMNLHLENIRAAAQEFTDEYSTHLQAERILKGAAFKPDDYPPVEKMKERMQTEFLILPMPEPGDFVKSLVGDAAVKMKENYEKALKHTESAVRQQVLGTMMQLVAETASSLAADGPIVDSENKKGPLAKLREYLDRVPQLNVTGDPEITAMLDECRKELDVSTEALRGSEFYRKKTAAAAVSIATKFGAVGDRKLAA